jgi:hypothetical protein
MKTQLHEVVGADEIVVSNGNGNGVNGGALTKVEAVTTLERVAFAEGVQRPPQELLERYEAILDSYAKKLQDRIELNVKKAQAIAEQGASANIEIGEPISGPYKWWDIFVIGPIQNINCPPFLPHKIVAAGELVHFLAFVVKNPLPTCYCGPSALDLMCGRKFCLNAELVNLTNVTNGPDLHIQSEFNSNVVQAFLFTFKLKAPECYPNLYEINVTADAVDKKCPQPFAAFATRILDIDYDPNGLPFPLDAAKWPHVHDEQPMRFLVYKR